MFLGKFLPFFDLQRMSDPQLAMDTSGQVDNSFSYDHELNGELVFIVIVGNF
jgi:hypothetical protein